MTGGNLEFGSPAPLLEPHLNPAGSERNPFLAMASSAFRCLFHVANLLQVGYSTEVC